MKSVRDEPLLSQVFLEIGETDRLKLFALSAGATRLWPREGGLQNTKRLNSNSPLRGPADTGRLSEGQKVKQGRLCRHFSRVFRENSPPQGPVYEFTRIDQGGQSDQSTGRQTGN